VRDGIWFHDFEPESHLQRWMEWRHTSARRKIVNIALLVGKVATGPLGKVFILINVLLNATAS